ncbi:MAG: glycosyltransferase [Akkermansia sp.]
MSRYTFYRIIKSLKLISDESFEKRIKKCTREYRVIKKSAFFDRRWYLQVNPDVAQAKIDPVLHFIEYGWREGRNPSPKFDTSSYIALYPDVKLSNVNPLFHYEYAGRKEGRMATVSSFSGINASIADEAVEMENPLVTVIVPNYNHEKYLRQRIDSILAQNYSPIEILLLDDCSSDQSRDILEEYQAKHPSIIRTVFNEKNSGGVFHQWRKGLSLAKGELIWIAESDDYCSENFLENLVPAFRYQSVMLAYGRTEFVKNGETVWTQEAYLNDVPKDWLNPFFETAHNMVNQGFGFKNIVPNVSSAVFRNTGFQNIINDPAWYNYKLCGDWIFYLSIIQSGSIHYNPESTNFYRLHESNTSGGVQQTLNYFEEHQRVAVYIAEHFKVEAEIFDKLRGLMQKHWQMTRDDFSDEALNECFDVALIRKHMKNRKPNVLMGIFALITGGGETFPIFLSNELKQKGLPVTILNFNLSETEEGIKKLIDPSIPLINTNLAKHSISWLVKNYGVDLIQTQHGCTDYHVACIKQDCPENVKHIAVLHGMYELVQEDILVQQGPVLNDSVDRWLYIADKNLPPFKKIDIYNSNTFYKVRNGLQTGVPEAIKRDQFGIPEDAYVLVSVSRGILEKGWIESVDAVSKARDISGKDIHLVLVGSGEAKDALEARSDLPSFVHLAGFQRNTRAYIAMGDTLLLASRFKGESFPLVVLDAIMCSKPVIASDLGETRAMITHESGDLAGEIFTLDDQGNIPIGDLAQIVAEFAATPELVKKTAAVSQELIERFSIGEVAADYMKHYHDVLELDLLTNKVAPKADRKNLRTLIGGGMPSLTVDHRDLTPDKFKELVGSNSGNMVFGTYGRKLLNLSYMKSSSFPFFRNPEPAGLREELLRHNQIVILAANWINIHNNLDFTTAIQFLRENDIPLALIGVGVHMKLGDTDYKKFISNLNPSLVKLLRTISSRSHSISVRGHVTKTVLNHLGIENVNVTGCPSWYGSGDHFEPIQKKAALSEQSNILYHSDHERRDLYRILTDKFKDYPDSSLLLQSEFDLLPYLYESSHDSYNNNYGLSRSFLAKPQFAQIFSSIETWEQYLKTKVDLCFGCRIHGNIIALKSGVPAIIIAHDARTKEMADFFSIPQVSVDEVKSSNFSINQAYDRADYSAMQEQYPGLLANYRQFLESNNIQTDC